MKIKVLLLAFGCSMMSFGAYAQKGVDTGTPFGSGEDSVRCITNISLFVPYAKAGNFKDAYEFWYQAYTECPGAHKDIYLYGVRIMDWKINTEKDPAKKAALIDDLMKVYDTRVKYFGNDRKYGKDWIIARKAADYIRLKGDNADPKVYYAWLGEVINEFGENSEAMGVSLYMMGSHRQLLADPNFKETYLEDYLKCSKIIATQLAAAQAANNEKEIKNLTTYKSAIDGGFAGSGAADCETLQNMYASKVEAAKDDLPALEIPGEAVLTGTNAVEVLSAARLSKEQTRARNKETLLEIINSTELSDAQKQEAVDSMVHMTEIAEKEAAAEVLLQAKGFSEAVVSINGDAVDVVVNAAELSDVQRAQIEDIVKRKTDIAAENIVISTITQ